MSSPLPPKKEVALALLERSSVFIHLDPRDESVTVPPWFKKQAQLVLQVGLNMAVQIPDLRVDDDSVSCTLSFSRRPHFCYIPWHVVYALVGEDGRGMVWPDDVPPEVSSQSAAGIPAARRTPSLRALGRSDPADATRVPRAPRLPGESRSNRPSQRPSLVALEGGSERPPPMSVGPSARGESEPPPDEKRPSKRPSWLRVVK